MKWSFQIARVGGIDVKIHLTFFLLLLWIGWGSYTRGGMDAAIDGILFILALFLCVLLHEFGHAFAAKAFGIRTPDITLLPIGGVARLEKMPENPVQELIIAVAGPMVNVMIAAVLFVYVGLSSFQQVESATFDQQGGFAMGLMGVNILLILFNMIPAFPMDGGRVLRALLAMRFPYARATAIAARIGQGIAVLFAIGGLFGDSLIQYFPVLAGVPLIGNNPILVFIALFIFMGAQQENAYAQMRGTFHRFRIQDIMLQKFRCLSESMTAEQCMAIIRSEVQPVYPVVDAGLGLRGLVERESLLQAIRARGANASLSEVMVRDVPKIAPDISLEQALEIMQREQCFTLPVVNPGGQIIGLVLLSQLMELARFSK